MATQRTGAGGQRGARSIGDDERKKGAAWWKWLLGLLVSLALIGLLIALLSGGDDKTEKAAKVVPTTPAVTPAATPAPAADGGTLEASGASLFPVSGDGTSSKVGQDATGTKDKVLSLTKSGFFVGGSEKDRVFVEYGNKVGSDEDKQSYKAKVGDVVDLTGPVRPAPQDPSKILKLGAADAATVSEQGAYVNADTVSLSQ